MKTKTRPDPDAGKTIGKLLDEVKELHNIEKYLQGDFP